MPTLAVGMKTLEIMPAASVGMAPVYPLLFEILETHGAKKKAILKGELFIRELAHP
jgi:hypothetical protein